jgi:ribosome-associated protein
MDSSARRKTILNPSELDFSFARSSGPGGQNVNKVNSKAILRWRIFESTSISQEVRGRFVESFSNRITRDGEVLIASDEFRDQIKNQNACIERLEQMLESVWRAPTPRKKSKPTKGSIRRRLSGKRLHSDKKASRKRITD